MTTFNPYVTTNAPGSFSVDSAGFISGTMLDNPPDLYRIAGGILANTELLPMWGGIAISEYIPGPAGAPNPDLSLGSVIGRATVLGAAGTVGSISGFSIFNQAHHMVTSPQSPVPTVGNGNSVNFLRLGCGARLAVPILPGLVSLDGSIVTQPVSWDFANQQITTYQAPFSANVLTGSTWASTAGGQVTFTTTTAHGVAVGSSFIITGSTPAAYNGTYIAITGTTGSTLIAAKTANPGAIVTEGSLAAGGGALPVKILKISIGNSMIPVFDPVTGFVTWNRSGSAAAILI